MRRGVAVFAAAFLVCQAADVYRVSGVVINSETGAPVPHAVVLVSRSGTTQTISTRKTGEDGRFAFELPEGKFHLVGGPRDMLQPFGIRRPDGGFGTSIITGAGQNTSTLIFRWFPLGAISGRVVDEAGGPVESALVQLVHSGVAAGSRVAGTARWVRTDDRGEYRFGAVRGGSYFLAVTGKPWYTRDLVVPGGTQPLAYAPAYYPSTTDMSRAEPMVLKPGQEARADFSLSVVSGAKVTVKHDAPADLKGLIALLMDGIGRGNGFQRQENLMGAQNEFTFDAVPPGRYVVRLTGSRGTSDFSGRQVVNVNGLDVAVELQVRPYPTVAGRVQLKDPRGKLPPNLLASLVREDTGSVISTVVRADGSFLFPSVFVTKWRPAIRGAEGYFASDVRVEGSDLLDGVIELREGESVTLQMTANDETGRVQGLVMSGATALEGVLVVLAPALGPKDQVRYRGFQTDSDGSFDFKNVPAAEYLLFAVEDTEMEYANPVVVKRYLGNAKRLRVEAHAAYSENIGIEK